MNTLLKLCIVFTAVVCAANLTHAQGTAFTYQGRLNAGGTPASGDYDLSFAVYDADSAGNLVAGPITNSPVAVSNGLFTVTLEFGAGVFTGDPRWLEIAVATAGSGAFETLSPRQSLLPTPYAIFAANASNVISGSAVKSLNALTDDVTLAAGANVTITPSGNTLTIDSAGAGGSGIWNLNGADTYFNTGNVGLGTISPASKLTLSVSGYGFEHTDGTRRLNTYVSTSGGWLGTLSNDPLNFFVNGGGSALTVTTGNKVGIGTTTPAAKLTVRTTGAFSAYGIEHTDGDVRLSTYLDAGYGAWFGTRSTHALNFFVNDGTPSMTIDTGGATIMTPIGGYGSFVVGTPNGESGFSIKNGNRADVRFNGSTIKMVAGAGVGPPSSFNGIAVTTAGNVGIGTDAPLARLDVRGTTRTCILSIVGGCDLAEPFMLKDEKISKGSVVVIDDEHPGMLMQSERAYDRRVAGIISGANGINPGITLQQEGAFVDGQNVALSGRVYVLADATQGAIKPGDLLTTSETPGHAMRAADHSRAQGAILGKAMSTLKDGKGLVLVLVTLQ
jgi:hypothetical protein